MKKNKLLTIAAILGVLSLLAAAAVSVGTADESAAQPDFTGYTAISTPQQLALIGNDPSYPLNGAYYLDNDISFASVDTNGGVDIDILVAKSGTVLTVVLMPRSGSVSLLHVRLGSSSTSSNNGSATLADIPQGVHVLTIGGQLDSSVPFAYSAEINTTADGTKTNGTFNSNGNFDPIGPANNRAFTGTFNGNGKMILGLNTAVFSTSNVYAGLFGYVGDNAQISDIGSVGGSVTAFSTTSRAYAGGIFGYAMATMTSMTMTDCYNTGLVAASSSSNGVYAGGIAGFVAVDSLTIIGGYNTGTIAIPLSANAYGGGLIGNAMGDSSLAITDCYNMGSVDTSASSVSFASGIAGSASASKITITDCYNTGEVTTSSSTPEAAGIVGNILFDLSATITGCYNTGSVAASSSASSPTKPAIAAGIVAEASTATVTDCYNTGPVTASSSAAYAGGIACNVGRATIADCNNDGPVTALASLSAYAGGITSSVTMPTTITDCYNTGTIAASSSSSSSPAYAGGTVGFVSSSLTILGCHNDGSVTASLTSASSTSPVNAGGIVGYTSQSITITDCYNTGSASASGPSSVYAGGIFANAMATSASMSITITDCYNTGSVTASSTSFEMIYAGGIAGFAASTSLAITGCHNDGPVAVPLSDTAYVGGLFGNVMGMTTLTIAGCYNTGSVSGSASSILNTGGIVGSVLSADITFTECYNTGSVSGSAYSVEVGGIVGDVMADASTMITDCHNTGQITASSSGMEALAGGIVGFIISPTAEVTDCHNTGSVTSSSSSAAANAGGIASNMGMDSTIAGCYNTGSVTASAAKAAYAGGIMSSVTTPAAITDCYNTGPVGASSTSLSAYAGGAAGYVATPTKIANCYFTGSVSASTPSTAYAGGVVGITMSSLAVTNCYFLAGQITVNSAQSNDDLYGLNSGTVAIDGGTVRSNGQDSGAKSASDMKPSLGDARAGNSIYFTGMTTVGSESVPGWDFDDIWVIFSEVNDGYPMPRSEASTVSGIVTEGVNPVAGATISYNGTYVTTDSAGRYVITVPYGSVVTITEVAKARHILRESLPLTFTLTSDVVQNFTMDKILLETSGEKIGSIGIVEGTADASSGASWVSINVRFSDGSFQRNVSRLVYVDSVAEFYVEFSSSSAQPVMYVVLLTDQRPVYEGVYTPLAMDAGGF